jgi:hypothetical protein
MSNEQNFAGCLVILGCVFVAYGSPQIAVGLFMIWTGSQIFKGAK